MKKLINKNIIKAMTLGISALMVANSMNLTAFAAEGETNTTPEGGNTNNGESETQNLSPEMIALQAEEGIVQSELSVALGVAEDTVDDVKDATAAIKDAADEAKTGTNETVSGAAQDILTELDNDNTSYQKADGTTVYYNDQNDKVGEDEVPVDANEEAGDAEAALKDIAEDDKVVGQDKDGKDIVVKGINGEIEYAVEGALKAEEDLDKAVEDAEVAVGTDAGSIVNIENVVDATTELVNEAIVDIKKATTADEARAKKDAAIAAINQVDGFVNTSAGQFALAQTNFTAAETELTLKVAEYEAAVDRWNNARNNAEEDIEACAEELKLLSSDVAALETAAKAARDELIKEGQGRIAYLEKRNSQLTTPSWEQHRELCEAIVEYYYIPEVLKGTVDYSNTNSTVATEWHKDWKSQYGENYTYSDGTTSPIGDVLNYGSLQYTDKEGNTQTLFYNYKTAEGNKQSSKGGIIIFEKVKHNVIGAEEIDDATLALLNEGKAVFDDENNATSVLVKEVRDGKDVYVRYNLGEAAGETKTYVKEALTPEDVTYGYDDTTEDGTERKELNDGKGSYKLIDAVNVISSGVLIDIDENSALTTYTYVDGKVVKVETANVINTPIQKTVTTTTTTTFTGNTLAAQELIETEESVIKAQFINNLRTAIGTLTEGQSLVSGDFVFEYGKTYSDEDLNAVYDSVKTSQETITGYTFNATYVSPQFTAQRNVKGSGITLIKAGIEYAAKYADAEIDFWRDYECKIGQRQYDIIGDIKETNKQTVDHFGEHYYACTIKADVVELSSMKVSKDWLWLKGVWKDDIEDVKETFDVDGKTYADYQVWGDGGNQYTVYYYIKDPKSQEVTISGSSKDVITDDAVKEAIMKSFNADSSSDTIKINVSYDVNSAQANVQKKYGYGAFNYFIKSISTDTATTYLYPARSWTDENKTISETEITKIETQDSVNVLKVEYRNDNWYSGNIILSEYDADVIKKTFKTDGKQPGTSAEVNDKNVINLDNQDKTNTADFRDWLKDAGTDLDKYDEILSKITTAQETIATSETEIGKLNTKIENLRHVLYDYKYRLFIDGEFEDVNPEDYFSEDYVDVERPDKPLIAKLIDAKKKLDEAKKVLDEAVRKRDALLRRIGELDRTFDTRVTELTPPATDEGGADEGGAVDGGAAVVLGAPGAAIGGGAPAVVDGDGGAAVADDGAPVITEEIGDEEAALAETIPTDEKKIYDIIDDPTALAELIEEPGVHIGWYWWLLIIAALGATGYALYRKYKKNKAAEANGGKKDQK